MSPFGVYMAGFGVLLLGLSLAAHLLGMPLLWIVILDVILAAVIYVLASGRGEE